MEDAKKRIEERLQELPKDVQAAILANDFEERIGAIGKSNRLHIDQIGDLGDETLFIMLGFSPIDGFADRLQKKLHLYDEQAAAIVTSINNDIFLPIRESMKKFQEQQERKTAPTPAPAAPEAAPIAVAIVKTPAQQENKPVMEAADMMLSQKTVSIPTQKIPPTTPVAPVIGNTYKTDPYREPVE